MLNKSYISVEEALNRLFKHLTPNYIPTETIAIEEAYSRVLAQDITASEDLPGFNRSTVDGYAVLSEDTFGAKETSPRYLTVIADIPMGVEVNFTLKKGECAKIATGGMLPLNADAVVMFEHTQVVSDDTIEVCRAVSRSENVILKDEDIKEGETVLPKGRLLRPQDIGALAGLGITEVEVYKSPKVSIISTGDEIVPANEPIKKGQVRDINSFSLDGLIRQCGGIAIKMGIFKDDYETIREVFHRALQDTDMVLISGGTSAGVKDMTAKIIQEAGSPGVLYHGVSVKPGKPLIGAVVNNKPVFGLPGHPAAIFVSFDTFIRPVLQRLCGLEKTFEVERTVKAEMTKSVASTAGRQDFIRVSLNRDEKGRFLATPILGKSGLITTLVKADGVVVIEPNKLGLDVGEVVEVRLF